MPFGITVTGDIFQWKLDQCFGHIKIIIVIANDLIVVGKKHYHRDHDIALAILLETARRNNVCLNYNKLQYKKMEVSFFGETYLSSGFFSAQTKVSVITPMPESRYKNQVHSFIGMVNYLSKFSARLSELAKLVRELAKVNVPFHWSPKHQEPFNLIQKEIAGMLILACYNARKQTTLQTDTSSKGLGVCILQEGKLVYFTSKALTKAQKWYVAIELESLMVVWALETFHHFLYSNHFILETDQKPLEAISSKSLNQATPQLQWICIRTFPYQFTVHYIPIPTGQLANCYLD